MRSFCSLGILLLLGQPEGGSGLRVLRFGMLATYGLRMSASLSGISQVWVGDVVSVLKVDGLVEQNVGKPTKGFRFR